MNYYEKRESGTTTLLPEYFYFKLNDEKCNVEKK